MGTLQSLMAIEGIKNLKGSNFRLFDSEQWNQWTSLGPHRRFTTVTLKLTRMHLDHS